MPHSHQSLSLSSSPFPLCHFNTAQKKQHLLYSWIPLQAILLIIWILCTGLLCTDCCYKYGCYVHVSFFNKLLLKMPLDAQQEQLQHVKYQPQRNCRGFEFMCVHTWNKEKAGSTCRTCPVGRLCCYSRQGDAVPALHKPAQQFTNTMSRDSHTRRNCCNNLLQVEMNMKLHMLTSSKYSIRVWFSSTDLFE